MHSTRREPTALWLALHRLEFTKFRCLQIRTFPAAPTCSSMPLVANEAPHDRGLEVAFRPGVMLNSSRAKASSSERKPKETKPPSFSPHGLCQNHLASVPHVVNASTQVPMCLLLFECSCDDSSPCNANALCVVVVVIVAAVVLSSRSRRWW